MKPSPMCIAGEGGLHQKRNTGSVSREISSRFHEFFNEGGVKREGGKYGSIVPLSR